MTGFGFIAGGVLSGLGAGMAKQGEMDFEQRRQAALENMRQQNQQANIKLQGEEQRQARREGALLDDKLDENSNNRRTKSTITIDKNRSKLDADKAERIARVEGDIARQNAEAAEKLKRDTDAGLVTDTFQDEQGNYFALYKGGVSKPITSKDGVQIKGPLKSSPASSGSGSSFEEVLKNKGSGGAPAGRRPPLSSFGS